MNLESYWKIVLLLLLLLSVVNENVDIQTELRTQRFILLFDPPNYFYEGEDDARLDFSSKMVTVV